MSDPAEKECKQRRHARHCREYRARRAAAGFRQLLLWVHQDSYERGEQAAAVGEPATPPTSVVDAMSWRVGYYRSRDT